MVSSVTTVSISNVSLSSSAHEMYLDLLSLSALRVNCLTK
jgi:hypothetical protein